MSPGPAALRRRALRGAGLVAGVLACAGAGRAWRGRGAAAARPEGKGAASSAVRSSAVAREGAAGASVGDAEAGDGVEVEVAGCAALTRGPVCEVAPGATLRIWVRAPRGTEAAFVDERGEALAAEATATGPLSARYEVRLGEATGRVDVRLGPAAPAARRVQLGPLREPGWLTEARALRRAGALDRSEALLRASRGGQDARGQAQADGLLARLALQRGDTEKAIAGLRASTRGAQEAGALSDAMFDAFALSYALVYEGRRFDEAKAALAEVAPLLEQYPEAAAEARYYEGLIAFETGDLRTALDRLLDAEARCERIAHRDYLVHIRHMIADTLQALGRLDEARDAMARAAAALPAQASPCERAWLLTNQAWLWLVEALAPATAGPDAPEQAEERRAQAEHALDEALRLYEGSGCARSRNVRVALLNRAVAAALARRGAEARRLLARLGDPGRDADPSERSWVDEIEARLLLGERRPADALARYERMRAQADRARSASARWRATLGRAEALEALGRDDEAAQAHADAEALLDQQALAIPLGEGRDTFFAERLWGARLRVDLLLRARKLPQALGAIRQSRSRALLTLRWSALLGSLRDDERGRWEQAVSQVRQQRAALEALARASWQVPASELPAHRARVDALERSVLRATDDALAALAGAAGPGPAAPLTPRAPGEVLLAMHPVRRGWIVLADTDAGLLAHRAPELSPSASPDALARDLLAPFERELRSARRLRVLAFGALRSVDVHALPLGGKPLAASLPVAYGLDLPALDAAPLPPRALVLADPRGDLPAARSEGEASAAALARLGVALTTLQGRAATLDALREQLPQATLFHFAGHGHFAGRDGWQSALPLAQDGRLAVGDVLTLERSPAQVLLSGCETGRSQPLAGETLGLAQAFLVAGARAALATTRPVDDALAARVASAVIERVSPTLDLVPAFEGALAALLAEPEPPPGWEAFRLFVP